jgi:ABC-type uncharacterized transport system permease subunit
VDRVPRQAIRAKGLWPDGDRNRIPVVGRLALYRHNKTGLVIRKIGAKRRALKPDGMDLIKQLPLALGCLAANLGLAGAHFSDSSKSRAMQARMVL